MRFSTAVVAAFALQVAQVLSVPVPQGAGTGAACDSLLSDTDDGTGYAVKNIEEAAAGLISQHRPKRQLNKWSDGLQDLSNAAGTGSSTSSLTTALDEIDGETTDSQANLGAELGDLEVATLESATSGGTGDEGGGSGSPPPPPPPGPHRL